ncbi:MAG: hypothetical protein LBB38_00725 [Puniceicoccales bacterium]|jgi:hypothetical protein|nr:hypothetical protein [Puniceicoccales bacterium]
MVDHIHNVLIDNCAHGSGTYAVTPLTDRGLTTGAPTVASKENLQETVTRFNNLGQICIAAQFPNGHRLDFTAIDKLEKIIFLNCSYSRISIACNPAVTRTFIDPLRRRHCVLPEDRCTAADCSSITVAASPTIDDSEPVPTHVDVMLFTESGDVSGSHPNVSRERLQEIINGLPGVRLITFFTTVIDQTLDLRSLAGLKKIELYDCNDMGHHMLHDASVYIARYRRSDHSNGLDISYAHHSQSTAQLAEPASPCAHPPACFDFANHLGKVPTCDVFSPHYETPSRHILTGIQFSMPDIAKQFTYAPEEQRPSNSAQQSLRDLIEQSASDFTLSLEKSAGNVTSITISKCVDCGDTAAGCCYVGFIIGRSDCLHFQYVDSEMLQRALPKLHAVTKVDIHHLPDGVHLDFRCLGNLLEVVFYSCSDAAARIERNQNVITKFVDCLARTSTFECVRHAPKVSALSRLQDILGTLPS